VLSSKLAVCSSGTVAWRDIAGAVLCQSRAVRHQEIHVYETECVPQTKTQIKDLAVDGRRLYIYGSWNRSQRYQTSTEKIVVSSVNLFHLIRGSTVHVLVLDLGRNKYGRNT
jgi:hypothetical protein